MAVESGLITVIQKRRAEIAFALADGHAVNIESYHRLVGTYQGLGEALDFINELLEEDDS